MEKQEKLKKDCNEKKELKEYKLYTVVEIQKLLQDMSKREIK